MSGFSAVVVQWRRDGRVLKRRASPSAAVYRAVKICQLARPEVPERYVCHKMCILLAADCDLGLSDVFSAESTLRVHESRSSISAQENEATTDAAARRHVSHATVVPAVRASGTTPPLFGTSFVRTDLPCATVSDAM